MGAPAARPIRTTLGAVLGSYAQVLFTRSRLVGLILLSAGVVAPRLLLAGVLSVLASTLTARLMSYPEEQIESGLFGYSALLTGLAGAALLAPGPRALALVAAGVVASVFVTAAFHSALGQTFNLPTLTLPFLAVFFLLTTAAPSLGVPLQGPLSSSGPQLPGPAGGFLRCLGAVFFLPRADAGLLVLCGLVAYSRVGVLLALLGFGVTCALGAWHLPLSHPSLSLFQGVNAILTAVALGGVWFVPSLASFLFASVGVVASGLVTAALAAALGPANVLILPFNLTVFLLLYAMRQRLRDGKPKSVDFLLGTPEENLNYYRTRVSRFGAHYVTRFQAPFLGSWTCTQGVDGELTHRGAWRHAFDFEVKGRDGRAFTGRGDSLGDYRCYRLPVLAPADGTVAKVVDGVPDNRVGEINLDHNWGNLVLLYHGPGLYSLVCHLSPRTTTVSEGQPVHQGDTLGLCGNSGRSPTPHLHFQLQATARIGAPTIHAELHDVVLESDAGPRLFRTFIPELGDLVRNLAPDEDLARLPSFTYGEPMVFETEGGAREVVAADIDLYGNLLLQSSTRSATLFYNAQRTHFTVLDTVGRRGSVLHLIHAALPRVPFEAGPGLEWDDVLPLRHFLPRWRRPLLDLSSPFLRETGIRVRYRMQRAGHRLVINGESEKTRRGRPLVRTWAVLNFGVGIEEIRLACRGEEHRVRRVREPDAPKAAVGILPALVQSGGEGGGTKQ
jgi:urea transporter